MIAQASHIDWSPSIPLLSAGIIAVLGVLFPGIVSVITALKVAKIEAHVNSAKTAAEGRELTLKAENIMLRELITEKTLTASLLAQAVAQSKSKVLGGDLG